MKRTPILIACAFLSCTPAERVTAGTAISTLAPTLCAALSALTTSSGSTVGLVCEDVTKALGAALLLARADASPVTTAAAPVARCTPLMLRDVDPRRDPREYVCREAIDEAAVRRALSVGHAR